MQHEAARQHTTATEYQREQPDNPLGIGFIAEAGQVSYRLTPREPNNQNAEVSHNTIRMANSTPPAIGSAKPG
jgi:hypothetical protein